MCVLARVRVKSAVLAASGGICRNCNCCHRIATGPELAENHITVIYLNGCRDAVTTENGRAGFEADVLGKVRKIWRTSEGLGKQVTPLRLRQSPLWATESLRHSAAQMIRLDEEEWCTPLDKWNVHLCPGWLT